MTASMVESMTHLGMRRRGWLLATGGGAGGFTTGPSTHRADGDQKRRRPPGWMILLIIVIVAALVWVAVRSGDREEASTTPDATVSVTTEAQAITETSVTDTTAATPTTTQPVLEPPVVELIRNSTGAMTVRGVVADQATADLLFGTAQDLFRSFRLINELSVGNVATTGGTVLLTGDARPNGASEAAANAAELATLLGGTVDDQRNIIGRVGGEDLTDLLNELAIAEPITFESDSATITPAGEATLLKALEYFELYPTVKVLIEGHTDSDADGAYNLELSERRAQAVLDFLVTNGVTGDRLRARGFGETSPIADNSTEEGKAMNRRIEFSVQE